MDNYEMLLEILSRLPVKSLLRFTSVCKHWKTLISSRHFKKMHLEKHTSSPPLLIASYTIIREKHYMYDPEFPDYEPDLETGSRTHILTYDLEGKIVGQINPPFTFGFYSMTRPPYQSKLLCFYRSVLPTEFYLYNPSTRRSFLLTNPYPFSRPHAHSSPELQLHYGVELGYIPSKDEYIVVHLVKSNGKHLCEVLNVSVSDDNFELRYSQWRTIEVKLDIHVNRLYPAIICGVFAGGAFYWLVINDPEDCFFLSLDVENEHFSTIGYPEPISFSAQLLELNGDLYLANFLQGPANLVLWKLCSDKSWAFHWEFDFERLFGFDKTSPIDWMWFRWEKFIYYLKYFKGYEAQPSDEQVSAEMGKLNQLPEGVDDLTYINLSVHTNMFTL